MAEPLASQYLKKLTKHLNDKLVSDPIDGVSGGLFHLGKYQDDPTEHTFIASIHEGGPVTVTKSGRQSWKHDQNTDIQREMTGAGEPCISYWTYRYMIQVQYFMVDTGEDQETARSNGIKVAQWIRMHVQRATPSVLGLQTSDYGETALEQMPVGIEVVEAGGPSAYIEKSMIFIEQLVMVS